MEMGKITNERVWIGPSYRLIHVVVVVVVVVIVVVVGLTSSACADIFVQKFIQFFTWFWSNQLFDFLSGPFA